LRAFLIKTQHALLGKTGPIRGVPRALLQPSPSNLNGSAYGSPYSQQQIRPAPSPTAWSTPAHNNPPAPSQPHPRPYSHSPAPASSPAPQQPGPAPLHPAIRPQYGNAWPQGYNPNAGQLVPGTRPNAMPQGTPPTPAPPKSPAFVKQSHSPIPLPPYAMGAGQGTPASDARHSPITQQPQQTGPSPSTKQSPPSMVGRPTMPPAVHDPQVLQPTHPNQVNHASHPPPAPALTNPFSGPKTETLPGSGPRPAPQHIQAAPPVDVALQVQQKAQEPQRIMSGAQAPPVFRDFPEVPADSMALVEKMMLNLRRASEQSESAV